ncbi:5-dehydro-4-deoxyglucarate dehydratase [Salsuginibacillus kocurii]|uniref:5-dehydro-4-deoxyglucarate dehydratase n=1 Tax=Salsuginibacillus kocurii TaxID=427078 RepID=UPI000375A3A5|nr:5-dehydro-4-deoxyglucarate dehydratase [Salsuginibacillus kocurii]
MEKKYKGPTGILGFPIAPFTNNGQVDEQALESNVDFLVKEGLGAIFINAGSSEFQSLSTEEYELMLDVTLATTNGKVPVYTGVGGNISAAVKLAELSEAKGAEGYLIMPPYLIHGEQEGLYHYYKTIIESTNLKALLYQRDNAIFTTDTLKKLADFEQVVGFKDGHGDMELNIEISHALRNRLRLMNGMPFAEVTMPSYYSIGFETYSSALSNYLPHISRMFFEALKNQEEDRVSELYQDVILPINQIRKLKKGYAVSLIKAGMEIVGLPVGEVVRAPLVPVEREHYQQLENVINRAFQRYPLADMSEVKKS